MDNGNDVIGVDLHEDQVRETRKKGVKALKARVQKLPFKDATFDIVTMAEVIEHFIETEIALKEIMRVLKPGGRIIITTPNFASIRDRILMIFGKLQAFAWHTDHVKFFNKERLTKVLKGTGYRNIHIHGSAFGFPIPKNAKVTYIFDGIFPAVWMQCLIAEARKPMKK
ncbi:methyltransferase domain-containing protein [Candidatus Micrarchaeota archaeon]|nr:methyltransferase domain-containing protein [Candidatus Micrarchaeota archaeon]